MTNENRQELYEDEIDLRELWKTIVKRKKFIFLFTSIVTAVAIIWALTRTPIYEAKAIVEVGSIMHNNNNNNNNNQAIENINNLVQRLQIVYMNNTAKGQDTTVNKVTTVKKTIDLIEISTHSISNEKAIEKLNEIVENIKIKQNSIINTYFSQINKTIINLKSQRELLSKKENQFKDSMSVKYNVTSRINELELIVSPENIKQASIVAKIITNDYPIKPKKKLIVTVAFVTGLILSIFLVFFLEFIRNDEK